MQVFSCDPPSDEIFSVFAVGQEVGRQQYVPAGVDPAGDVFLLGQVPAGSKRAAVEGRRWGGREAEVVYFCLAGGSAATSWLGVRGAKGVASAAALHVFAVQQ